MSQTQQLDVTDHSQPPIEIPLSTPEINWTIVRQWIRSHRNLHTKRSYAHNADQFFKTVHKPLEAVTLTDLQDYNDFLVEMYPEVGTQAQKIASIKSLFTFAHTSGYLRVNVGAAVQLPLPKNKLAERILNDTELHKLLIQAERSGNKRNYTLVVTLYGSAARCGEICNLRWRDCQENKATGQITVQGKRDKTRSIMLHPKVWSILMEHKATQPEVTPDDYVFQSRQASKYGMRISEVRVWQIISEIAKAAGIKHASPHFLRHTHASNALRTLKVTLKLLQETLGHEDLTTTGRYLHAMPEDSSSMYLEF